MNGEGLFLSLNGLQTSFSKKFGVMKKIFSKNACTTGAKNFTFGLGFLGLYF